jgi:hypothetical protein
MNRLACSLLFSFVLATGAAQAAQPSAAPNPPQLIAIAQPEPLTVARLIEQLRTGRNLLLIRHERTEVPSAEDDYAPPATNCITQRNLSAAGFSGAQETRVGPAQCVALRQLRRILSAADRRGRGRLDLRADARHAI